MNINIPLRNRTAQADQARSQMEYRQSQMRLQQLYTQIRIQVINAAVCADQRPGAGEAAQAARDYAAQSLDAEQKKYKLGASTTALVLQQERNLATAENTLISATAAYAKDRAALRQLLRIRWIGTGSALRSAATGSDRTGSGDSGADGADGSGGTEADLGGLRSTTGSSASSRWQ